MSFPLVGNPSEERLRTSRNDSERHFQMKRIFVEGFLILIISLIISLVYSANSSTGIILLKKAFGIKAKISNVITAPEAVISPEGLLRYI